MTLPAALQLGIDPSARRPLRDEAYIALRHAILAGDFRPGDRLVERAVAAKLNLSRSPVREAFRRLEQEGLVSVTRQGLLVQQLDAREVEELYFIRQQLEASVARLAAQRFEPQHLSQMDEVFRSTVDAVGAGDDEAAAAAGARFHRLLAGIAGNRRLERMTVSLAEEIDRYRRLNLTLGTRTVTVLDEHRGIWEAIIAGDTSAAERLMSEHIAHSLQVTKLLAGKED